MLLTCPAGVSKPGMDDHVKRRRLVFELLADLCADLDAQAAALRAGQLLVGQLVLDPPSGQVLGEPLSSRAPPVPLWLHCMRPRWLSRDDLGDVLRRVLGEQLELVRIDALPPRAELATEQQLELVLQLLDPPSRP